MLISEIFLELLQPMEEEHTIVRGHRCRGVVNNHISGVIFLILQVLLVFHIVFG